MDKVFYLPSVFHPPPSYHMPHPEELATDTNHPELNSLDWITQHQEYRPPNDFLSVFSNLILSDGLFILAANNYTSSVFDGIIIASEDFSAIEKHDINKTKFSFCSKAPVNNLLFLDSTTFLSTTDDSDLQLWSTRAKNTGNGYVPFKMSESDIFDGYIKTMVKMFGSNELILGTSHGHIDIMEYGNTELSLVLHTEQAHSDQINCISPSPVMTKSWVSCSDDHSCLLWDKRKFDPASALLEDHDYALKSVYWTKEDENKSLVMIGDEIGNLMMIDIRKPCEILTKERLGNRAIRKIAFNGSNQFGILTSSRSAKIIQITANNEYKLIYEHSESPSILQDLIWDDSIKDTFYVVGQEMYAKKVVITNP